MAETLFSPSWYRVARLQPRIRGHARFHRHHYRGQLWYVLQDHSSGRSHRLTPAAYHLAGLMNGERTTQQIWEAATERLGDEGPTQDETIRLLGLLHFADVLRCDVSPDTLELFRRSQRREQSEWWQRFVNPLALRFPLFDPDDLLERWLPTLRPLFGWAGALVWLAVVLASRDPRRIALDGAQRGSGHRDPRPAQPAAALAGVPDRQGPPRVRPRVRRQGVGWRGPRDGRDVPGAGAHPLCRRVLRIRLSREAEADAGRGRGNPGRALSGLAGAVRLARRRARPGPLDRLRRDADRRRIHPLLQWQSAAEVRRILRSLGRDRDPQSGRPLHAVPRLSGAAPASSVWSRFATR